MFMEELETFVKVVECGSFTKAAQALFVTAASVMKQMNDLERQIGAPLLERSNRGVRLTAAGRSLHRDAVPFLEEKAAMLGRARAAASVPSATVRIGISALTQPSGPLQDLWSRLGRSNPEFRLQLVSFEEEGSSLRRILESMGPQGPFDCLVSVFASRSHLGTLAFLPLGSYPIQCAVPLAHPLANKQRLSVSDLEEERLMLVRAGNSPYLDEVRAFLEREHPTVELVDTGIFYDIGDFNTAERQGMLLLTTEAWRNVHPGLATIPIDWDFTVPYGIVYPNDAPSETLRFVEAAASACSDKDAAHEEMTWGK